MVLTQDHKMMWLKNENNHHHASIRMRCFICSLDPLRPPTFHVGLKIIPIFSLLICLLSELENDMILCTTGKHSCLVGWHTTNKLFGCVYILNVVNMHVQRGFTRFDSICFGEMMASNKSQATCTS